MAHAATTSDARSGRSPRELEQRLLRRYRDGDMRARDDLAAEFGPLVRRLAGRYRHTNEPREDLEQVAYVGLLKAIDRYDPNAGPFVGYAVPNVLGELRRHFRDRGWAMHVPRSLQLRLLAVNAALEALPGKLGRSPTAADVAEHSGLTTEQVGEAMEAGTAYAPTALDAPFAGDPDGDRTLLDTLGHDDGRFELVELGESIAPLLAALPERERTILALRFREDLTQSEIADRIGVSQMHVSRLLRRALARLGAAVDHQADDVPSRSASGEATTGRS